MKERRCPICKTENPDKGRALDGRRAYRCKNCHHEWTEGMQGRKKRYSIQRNRNQFSNNRPF